MNRNRSSALPLSTQFHRLHSCIFSFYSYTLQTCFSSETNRKSIKCTVRHKNCFIIFNSCGYNCKVATGSLISFFAWFKFLKQINFFLFNNIYKNNNTGYLWMVLNARWFLNIRYKYLVLITTKLGDVETKGLS